MFYWVKWCTQVSLAVNMDSTNSHSSFNHWRCGGGRGTPNYDFYALLSHIWYTTHMHFAISMLFMNMVLKIVIENSSVADTQFFWFANHALNSLFHIHLHSTHIIASINLTTVFAHAWLQSRSLKVLIKTSFSQRPDCFLLGFIFSTTI